MQNHILEHIWIKKQEQNPKAFLVCCINGAISL